MASRRTPLALAVLVAACSGGSQTADPAAPAPDAEALEGTWPVQTAVDAQLPEDVVLRAAARWLGGAESEWAPPGMDFRSKSLAAGKARSVAEDRAAFEHLSKVLFDAACRLARAPGTFDAELALGYRAGAEACAALGDDLGRALAEKQLAALELSVGPEYAATSKASGVPVTVTTVRREGVELRYAFVAPADVAARKERISDPPSDAPRSDAAMTSSYIARVGTSRWADAPIAELPSIESIWEGSEPPAPATAETAVEGAVRSWRAGLAKLPEGQLDAGARTLLEKWATRALNRELGLRYLEAGLARDAVVFLEEAANSEVRPRPGSGMDPLLLAALARARFEANELERAVTLLDDIGEAPGWDLAGEAARAVARVVALPTAGGARINK